MTSLLKRPRCRQRTAMQTASSSRIEFMKALSLTQPWATAIATELKQWETRSWPTHFRGEVCIHASKGFPKWAREFAEKLGFALTSLPLGAIIAVCDLTECRQTDSLINEIDQEEIELGDYAPGRYAFKLENVRRLKEPVAAKGALGFWAVEDNSLVAIRKQLIR
jgi:activating signal cointegrator 1